MVCSWSLVDDGSTRGLLIRTSLIDYPVEGAPRLKYVLQPVRSFHVLRKTRERLRWIVSLSIDERR